MRDSTFHKSGKKLSAKYTPLVFAFYMSLIMAFLMSFIIVAANSGITEYYFTRVLQAYRIAMPSAFLCILIVRPVVLQLVSRTVHN